MLSSDGLLNIYGSGKTEDYTTASMTPWYKYSNIITVIYITESITEIGNFGFYTLKNIEAIKVDNPKLKFFTYSLTPNADLVFYEKGGGSSEKFTAYM